MPQQSNFNHETEVYGRSEASSLKKITQVISNKNDVKWRYNDKIAPSERNNFETARNGTTSDRNNFEYNNKYLGGSRRVAQSDRVN